MPICLPVLGWVAEGCLPWGWGELGWSLNIPYSAIILPPPACGVVPTSYPDTAVTAGGWRHLKDFTTAFFWDSDGDTSSWLLSPVPAPGLCPCQQPQAIQVLFPAVESSV